jgi:HSP90 family molecular chaperone
MSTTAGNTETFGFQVCAPSRDIPHLPFLEIWIVFETILLFNAL